jgi:hypothetical protein
MTEGSALPGFELGVRAKNDEVYYTTDGTDPRMRDGSINPAATRLGQAETEPIIAKGSDWKYHDTGTRFDRVDWTALDYNDSNWKSGKAELGYGDGDEVTAVDRGSEPSSKYHTTIYFRKEFQMGESHEKSLFIKLLRDDGAVVYLNGEELFRSNMRSGTVRYSNYTSKRNSTKDSRIFFPYYVEIPMFINGRNVFAVEVHRGSRSDKDLSFDFEASIIDSSGTPVPIERTSTIIVRAKSDQTWSAPSTASIVISPSAALKVTELMYNPTDGKTFEFIELKNTSGATLDLTGVSLSGVRFTFDEGALAPWRSGVLIANDDPTAFISKYPNAPIIGTYAGSLSNSGEELRLLDPDGQIVYSVNYSSESPWPSEADGNGSSLELISSLGAESDPSNWRASLVPGGTPGDILFLSTELSLTGGRMAIRFLALPGNSYSLYTSDDLGSGNWQKLGANEFVSETKVVEFIVSTKDGDGQQFYRVSSP